MSRLAQGGAIQPAAPNLYELLDLVCQLAVNVGRIENALDAMFHEPDDAPDWCPRYRALTTERLEAQRALRNARLDLLANVLHAPTGGCP